MRAFCGGSLVLVCLVLTGVLRADDQAGAGAVIDKAVQAMGGAEKVAKFAAAGTFKCKITHERDGKQMMITCDGAWQGLDRARFGGELTGGGETGTLVVVINGDMGWAKKNGEVRDAPEGMVPAIKSALYGMRMPHLLPGLKDKAFTLTPRGEEKVDDKEAIGLRVSHKDHQDVSVLFDKKTGLPLKSETRITGPDNKEITVETFYSDFREVHGVKHPMKITLKADGGEFAVEISDIQPKDKVDESEFAKP